MPTDPQRAVLYIRVSALMGREGEDFHSPEVQADAMRRAIGQAGLREVAIVDDDIDVSGQTFSRAGLDKIRALVEAKRVDVLTVYNLSRLGRNLAEALTFIRWLRDRGVAVMSVLEKFDDTPEGQFQLGLWLGLAELYGAQVGRGWRAVISKRAQAGYHHGIPPLGYRRAKGQKVMEHDPVLGPIIAEMFRRFVNAGHSTGMLTRYLAVSRGKRVTREQVRAILANPVYTGKVVLWPDGVNRKWDTVPLYLGEGLHEPLVNEVTFRKARRLLEMNSSSPARHLLPSHSLVGLVRCGVPGCGLHLRKETDRRPGRGIKNAATGAESPVVRLRCTGLAVYRGVRTCIGVGTPHLDEVEAHVLKEVTRYVELLRADSTARAERCGRSARAQADSARTERELVAVRQEMAKLTKGWQRGIVPDSAYEANIAELRAAEAGLDGQMTANVTVVELPQPEEWVAIAVRLLELWPDLTVVERNVTLRRIVKSVTIAPPSRRGEPAGERTIVDFL